MSRLAVLGEIGAPVAADGRPWALRSLDFEALGAVRESLGARRSIVVVGPPGAGDEDGSAPGTAGAVAVGLVAVAAAAGSAAVLVECDIGRPRLARHLGLRPVPGLHEYLRWEATPEDVLQTLVPAGAAAGERSTAAACVCAGRPGDSPHTLLGLGSFRHMTAKLRDAYELTVLLAASAEGTGGSVELVAAEADCSIAALWSRPSRRDARSIRDALSRIGAPPLGAVVVKPAAPAD